MLKRRQLRRYISYDKITGLILTEYEITLQAKGYVRVLINGEMHRLSDVIWALVHGSLPEHAKVIQLSKNKLDFRLSNLYLDMTRVELINKKIAVKSNEEFFKNRTITKDILG